MDHGLASHTNGISAAHLWEDACDVFKGRLSTNPQDVKPKNANGSADPFLHDEW